MLAIKGPVRKAKLSILPFKWVLALFLDINTKRLLFSYFIKGSVLIKLQVVYKSHLR
jgi:hypothetical protein